MSVNYLKYNFEDIFRIVRLPEYLVFYVTFRCNARCKACNIWKGDNNKKREQELDLTQISQIFSKKIFANLLSVNLQGGEPSLRDDLPKIAEIICQKAPKIQSISITTNGLDTERTLTMVRETSDICKKYNKCLVICFSVDGIGEYHDYARGHGAFEKVSKTIEKVKEIKNKRDPNLVITTNCLLTTNNIYNINEIEKWQREVFSTNNLSIVEFREHFLNAEDLGSHLLFEKNRKEKEMLIRYLDKRRRSKRLIDFISFRFNQLKKMLEYNIHRTQSCEYLICGLVMNHLGEIQVCPIGGKIGWMFDESIVKNYYEAVRNQKRILKKKRCNTCYPYNFYTCEIEKDLVKYIYFYLKKIIGGET